MEKILLINCFLIACFSSPADSLKKDNSTYSLISNDISTDFIFYHEVSDKIRLLNVSGSTAFVPEKEFKDTIYEIEEGNARIKVAPNPVLDNVLLVELSSEKQVNYKAKLYNIIGRVVSVKEISNGNNSISLEDLGEGIYFLDIVDGKKTIRSMKIIKR